MKIEKLQTKIEQLRESLSLLRARIFTKECVVKGFESKDTIEIRIGGQGSFINIPPESIHYNLIQSIYIEEINTKITEAEEQVYSIAKELKNEI